MSLWTVTNDDGDYYHTDSADMAFRVHQTMVRAGETGAEVLRNR